MTDRPQGEFDTLIVKRHWTAIRADGRKALLLETIEERKIALELPQAILTKLAADLAILAAQTPPPNKPNA
jgi:hypothetical protein